MEEYMDEESQILLKNFKSAKPHQQFRLLKYLKTKHKRPDPSNYKYPEEIVPKINPLDSFEKALEKDKNDKQLDMEKQRYRELLNKLNKYRTV